MIGPIRRKVLLPAVRERRFWMLLGIRALAWRRFVRRLAARGEDLAILRLTRRPDAGERFHVRVVYGVAGRARPRLSPLRLYLPDDDDRESRLGVPDDLRGRPFFAAESPAADRDAESSGR